MTAVADVSFDVGVGETVCDSLTDPDSALRMGRLRDTSRGLRSALLRLQAKKREEMSEALSNLATKVAVEGKGRFQVHAPLLKKTKAEIIRIGASLGVDYSLTLSCYDPDASGRACGRCDSCRLRLKGFHEAGIADPAAYRQRPDEGGGS